MHESIFLQGEPKNTIFTLCICAPPPSPQDQLPAPALWATQLGYLVHPGGGGQEVSA